MSAPASAAAEGHPPGRAARAPDVDDRRGRLRPGTARCEPRGGRRGQPLVVKVGSSSLTTAAGGLDDARLDALVDALAAAAAASWCWCRSGCHRGRARAARAGQAAARPRHPAGRRVGRSGRAGAALPAAFARHGRTVGQVLLTADDVVRRAHYSNAQTTLERLLALGVVPVVNENDAVATEEIRFGDNDRLAALVAHLVRADALVLLATSTACTTETPAPGAAYPEVRRPRTSSVRSAAPARRRHRRHGHQGRRRPGRHRAGMPVLLGVGRGRPRRCAARAARCSRRPAPAAAAGCSGWRMPHPARPAGARRRRRRARSASAGSRCCPPASPASGRVRGGRPGGAGRAGGQAVARGLVAYDAAELPALLGRSTRELGCARSSTATTSSSCPLTPQVRRR